MPFATINEAVEDFRAGRLVIIVDDEDRENEGDIACAAEKVTPDVIGRKGTRLNLTQVPINSQ
jgi:3,4-dihydroxy 2-butanone 4-phosphate synthase/GTP cyclohydrolase II